MAKPRNSGSQHSDEQAHPSILRHLDLKSLIAKKSHILLGPRQTGKSFLIRSNLPDVKKYNLLLHEDYRRLSFDPTLIRKELTTHDKFIVIDEIQRLPGLLDEVHYLIEEKSIKFLLTGSSVRKLKGPGINLLGGRACQLHIHPFTFLELNEKFDLSRVVNFGLLPGIYFSDEPQSDLAAYVSTYIEQEIAAEGLVRNLSAFTRFLEVSALCCAEQIDFTSISNDAQIPRTTIHEYFKILEDTLIGYVLPAWQQTKKRKPIATGKFYFFDWAIPKYLQSIESITPKSEIFGKAFETYLFHELKTYCDYTGNKELHYWRSKGQDEVDFIVDNRFAVEVKATTVFKNEFIRSISRLREENLLKEYIIVYLGKDLNLDEHPWLKVMNYQSFLRWLYQK